MQKALDIAGVYEASSGIRVREHVRSADDLRTPGVHDDVVNMRGDFNRVGGDMRKALKKHPRYGRR